MFEILETLVKYWWLADFTALCIFFAIYQKRKEVSSSLLTTTVIVVVSFILINYEALIFSIKGPVAANKLAWFTVFAVADIIVGFALYRLYKSLITKYSRKLRLCFSVFSAAFMIALASIQLGPLLFDSIESNHKLWVRASYYLGSVLFYIIATYAIQKLHRDNRVTASFLARTYIIAYFAATNLQIFRFLERLTWDTNFLEALYKWGFVTISFCTTAVTLLVAILAVFNQYSKTKHKGILWNI
jgi:hypothetical protein